MFKMQPERIPYDTVTVMLNSILTKPIRERHGNYRIPEGSEINERVLENPLFRGKRVILLASGQDILIETVWCCRRNAHWQKDTYGEPIGDLAHNRPIGIGWCWFRIAKR
jgi:hypothetical protein